MGMLVDALLRLGKIGRQELVRQPTDLSSLLQSALQDLQPELEGRQIEWRIAELPVVECDPGLMKQVFANLLSNAVKYTRRREFTVIQVGHATVDGAPVIFIRDNGAGFNQQYADKLFGVFQRLHRAEDFEGTGIGLATIERIIRRHGGRVWAEGEVEKGATFSFSLAASSQGLAHVKASAAVG
jgi:light-regulated signal transduction histidine kinase (bacteriophytochrome)